MRSTPTYLVTGAAGGVGGVSRLVVEQLIARDETVRAMVHREDSRANALREVGAQVVVGDLTNPADVAAAMSGITRMFFNMSVSASYLEATAEVCVAAAGLGGLELLVNMSQMTVSEMTATSTGESRQHRLHWLAEHVINWSPIPAVHVRPTVFLDNPLFTVLAAQSIREHDQLALPFGTGRTSPIAAADVADAVAAVWFRPTSTSMPCTNSPDLRRWISTDSPPHTARRSVGGFRQSGCRTTSGSTTSARSAWTRTCSNTSPRWPNCTTTAATTG